jgi:Putative MetA-pathway of phenol degradation
MITTRHVRGWSRIPPIGLGVLLVTASAVTAQELEPRAYSPSPVGTTFLLAGLTHSTGTILFDPTVPIENVESRFDAFVAGAGRTFDLFGRQSAVLVALPLVNFRGRGDVGEERQQVSRSGQADLRVKWYVNLVGSPALPPAAFVKAPPRTSIGVALTVAAPIGQYNRTKLVNLGSHRWSFKPEVGFYKPIGRWTIEGAAGVWLFTANDEFYPGESRQTQRPVASLQAHVSYNLSRRAWVALDSSWYHGGQSAVDGVVKSNLQSNSRFGATLSLPIGGRQSIKLNYSAGAFTRFGGDYDTFGVSWQMVRF